MKKVFALILAFIGISFGAQAQSQFWHGPNCREITKDEVTCLACVVYFESKTEPLEDKLSTAFVTVNRTRSEEFPKTMCGNIRKPGEYSWMVGRATPNNIVQWNDALKVARVVWELSTRIDYADWDITGNSLFFHAHYINPGWRYERIGRIGSHVHYTIKNKKRSRACTDILDTRVGDC